MLKKQRGYFFTDAFTDMIFLSVGILVLVIAVQLYIPFANMLSNTVSGESFGSFLMTIVWILPLLFVAILIMPIVKKFTGDRPPGM
jgi:ABC-type sugar transport system permease subunit